MSSIRFYIISFLFFSVSVFAQKSEKAAYIRIEASLKGGFYKNPVEIDLLCKDSAAHIYYTLDGSPPGKHSKKYFGPIKIKSNSSLQAIAYKGNERISYTLTENYFINERFSFFPTVCITIHPTILYDPYRGLLRQGPRAANGFPHKGANYYSNREVIAHIEIFESPDSNKNRNSVFKSRIGLSVFGGISRIFPQKSLAIYARSKYGLSHIEFPLYPNLPIKKYKRIVLRNSGSDYGETHFRDAFITSIGKEMGLDVQAYRPSIVYINGRYHGVMNIREKLTKHYFKEHYNINPDSIDLLEGRGYVKAGSNRYYKEFQTFISDNNLSDPDNFSKVKKMIDIDNFIEFYIIQIYSDNQDAGGNVKFWRPHGKKSKWRWILFDTDFGFGHYSKGGYNFNTLKMQTELGNVKWPNPNWSTFNLRNMLKSPEFRKRFVKRFCDRINYNFVSKRLVERIDSMANYIKPEMPRHWKRWGLTPGDWDFRVKQMKEFAEKRPAYMKKFIQEKFPEFGAPVDVTINIDGGGYLTINKVIPVKGLFKGFYFKNLDIDLIAQPFFGYVFSHWELNGRKISDKKELNTGFDIDSVLFKAVFVKKDHPLAKHIIINEISCRDTFSGDWIEFYNNSNEDLNLKGWILRDGDNNEFVFPKVILKKKTFLVLCREEEKFLKIHPKVKNLISGLNFGLGRRKDRIELYSTDFDPVDSVGYKIGRSKDSVMLVLVLRDFENDNSDYERNWKYERSHGSPGVMNPIYLEWKNMTQSASDDGEDFDRFLQTLYIGIFLTLFFSVVFLSALFLKNKVLKKRDEMPK